MQALDKITRVQAELEFDEARRLPEGVVRLQWFVPKRAQDTFFVEVANLSDNGIRDLRVFVTDLRRFKEPKGFVEVPDFHKLGAFEEVELETWGHAIFYGEPLAVPFLSQEPHQLTLNGKTRAGRRLTTSGLWRATSRCETGGRHWQQSLCFEWAPNSVPAPAPFPSAE
jgi:hypothetical protein